MGSTTLKSTDPYLESVDPRYLLSLQLSNREAMYWYSNHMKTLSSRTVGLLPYVILNEFAVARKLRQTLSEI